MPSSLTQQLGASVQVENKTGGGAVIGIDAVAKAPPDGYTLLVTTTGTVMQNRVLYTKLPYNLDKDLVPITVFPSGPLVVGVAPHVPAANLQEFVAWAAGKDLSMGSYAPGSYPHMLADLFSRNYGLKIQVVQYRGESPMWVDMASSQLHIAVGSYQAYNTVAQRGLKAIGVTGKYRSPKLPQVQTLIEQGVTGTLVPLEGGLALMAPAGTPEAVLRTLSGVVVKGAETEQSAKLRENFAHSEQAAEPGRHAPRLGSGGAGLDQGRDRPGRQARLSRGGSCAAPACPGGAQVPSRGDDQRRHLERHAAVALHERRQHTPGLVQQALELGVVEQAAERPDAGAFGRHQRIDRREAHGGRGAAATSAPASPAVVPARAEQLGVAERERRAKRVGHALAEQRLQQRGQRRVARRALDRVAHRHRQPAARAQHALHLAQRGRRGRRRTSGRTG